MSNMIFAPFSAEQVEKLNDYQRSDLVHAFTCGRRGDPPHRGECELVATIKGWICVYCDYEQDWAHSFMADGSALENVKRMVNQFNA